MWRGRGCCQPGFIAPIDCPSASTW
jgi:hypothetical protein